MAPRAAADAMVINRPNNKVKQIIQTTAALTGGYAVLNHLKIFKKTIAWHQSGKPCKGRATTPGHPHPGFAEKNR